MTHEREGKRCEPRVAEERRDARREGRARRPEVAVGANRKHCVAQGVPALLLAAVERLVVGLGPDLAQDLARRKRQGALAGSPQL